MLKRIRPRLTYANVVEGREAEARRRQRWLLLSAPSGSAGGEPPCDCSGRHAVVRAGADLPPALGKSERVLPNTCARIRARIRTGQAARGVVWAGVGLGEELVEVMARQHKLPIGAHRKEELERRSSMDIRHPQWSMLVVTPDNISWPTRGPNVDATIGSTMRSRGGLRAKSTCK